MKDKKVIVKYANMFGTEPKGIRQYEITIPSSGNTKKDLETVFRYMQHVDGSKIESQLIALKERSLSVGDSCIIDGKEYLCMMGGWKEMKEIPPPAGTRNICADCDEVIEFTGEYWRHLQSNPRHGGVPKNKIPNNDSVTIEIEKGVSVTLKNGSVTTEGWKTNEKSEAQDWSFLEADQQEAIEEDLTNARVDGMVATLLALQGAGILNINDQRLKQVLVAIHDALTNES